MKPGELTWEEEPSFTNTGRVKSPTAPIVYHHAWSDQLRVGSILPRADGSFFWDATWAVKLEDQQIARSTGAAATLEEAKAAVQNAWTTWLRFAGLIG